MKPLDILAIAFVAALAGGIILIGVRADLPSKFYTTAFSWDGQASFQFYADINATFAEMIEFTSFTCYEEYGAIIYQTHGIYGVDNVGVRSYSAVQYQAPLGCVQTCLNWICFGVAVGFPVPPVVISAVAVDCGICAQRSSTCISASYTTMEWKQQTTQYTNVLGLTPPARFCRASLNGNPITVYHGVPVITDGNVALEVSFAGTSPYISWVGTKTAFSPFGLIPGDTGQLVTYPLGNVEASPFAMGGSGQLNAASFDTAAQAITSSWTFPSSQFPNTAQFVVSGDRLTVLRQVGDSVTLTVGSIYSEPVTALAPPISYSCIPVCRDDGVHCSGCNPGDYVQPASSPCATTCLASREAIFPVACFPQAGCASYTPGNGTGVPTGQVTVYDGSFDLGLSGFLFPWEHCSASFLQCLIQTLFALLFWGILLLIMWRVAKKLWTDRSDKRG